MQRVVVTLSIICSAIACVSCADVPSAAPGAIQIRLTNVAADVAGCKSVGNIRVPAEAATGMVDMSSASTRFRNQAVGFGANTGFVTEGSLSAPVVGIAYRCP
jgi:hypothetical protein